MQNSPLENIGAGSPPGIRRINQIRDLVFRNLSILGRQRRVLLMVLIRTGVAWAKASV